MSLNLPKLLYGVIAQLICNVKIDKMMVGSI